MMVKPESPFKEMRIPEDNDILQSEEPELIQISASRPTFPVVVNTTDEFLGLQAQGDPRKLLYWVDVKLQGSKLRALGDTGSCRNLISYAVWDKLAYRPSLTPPGNTRIIAGNGEPLGLVGWILLKFEIAGQTVLHEVGVVQSLPVDFIVGGEFFFNHRCMLGYEDNFTNCLILRNKCCLLCKKNYKLMKVTQDPQICGMNRVSSELLACLIKNEPLFDETLAETSSINSKIDVVAEIDTESSDAACMMSKSPEAVNSDQVQCPAELIPETESNEIEIRRNNLQKVIAELKIHELQISATHKHRLIEIINKNLAAFAVDDDDLGRTDLVMHPIDVGNNSPFKEKRRPTPYAAREFVQTEIKRYKDLGIVSDADLGNCPYSSAIVVVPKKDGTFRLCIDYRRLNEQTVKDTYQLPLIQEIFNALAGNKFFIALDLLMGYHQIAIKPEDRLKTAFFAEQGLYMFNLMPFGLCNAPATFQRLMDRIFVEDLFKDILAYLDDLLVYGKSIDEVLTSFDKCLKKLIAAGLKCKPRKCKILPEKLEYLGHILSAEGITADKGKVEKIREWPFPKNKTEMQSFLGLCNYYRRLVPEYAEPANALYKATGLTKWESTPDLVQAFEFLKDKLCSISVVKLPDVSKPFILTTDASNYAVGAELCQSTGVIEAPVLWFSKALTSSQLNYSTYERELLAVVLACEHFALYLLGRAFKLRTDHRALMGIFNSKIGNSSRVAKWVLKLQPYKFEIEIIK